MTPQAIGCTGETKIEMAFFCKALGLTVEEDEKGMVIVAGWEERSAAAEHPSLMVRKINGLLFFSRNDTVMTLSRIFQHDCNTCVPRSPSTASSRFASPQPSPRRSA